MSSPDDLSLQGLPLVTDPTRAQSENIQTVVSRMANDRIIVPPYQRDADQWDDRKESLFVESLVNNLTIPAFFFAEQPGGTIEVVDGQQRLSTIRKFRNNEFPISDDESMVYLTPQSVHYRGKKYSDLAQPLKNVFDDYPLTIIYLPKNIDLTAKLEIFRRINEGGTPLSGQDIRLAYYSESKSVTFIRLAGLYSDTVAARRMLESAKERGVSSPWPAQPKAEGAWRDWWMGTLKAKGQTPSEMFLWYLVQKYRELLDKLVETPDSIKHLGLSFRGSTEEVLDIVCAQLQYTDSHGGASVLPIYGAGLEHEFDQFVKWVENILNVAAGMGVDKYKQMALLIGAAVELKVRPSKLTQDQWDAIAEFIRTPRSAGSKWLGPQGYPEPKGRWNGAKGQNAQCNQTVALLRKIVESG